MRSERDLRVLLVIGLSFLSFQLQTRITLAASNQNESGANGRKQVLQVPAGWNFYHGADGLVVFHPNGWQVQQKRKGAFGVYRVGSYGGIDAVALVQPLENFQGPTAGVLADSGRLFHDILSDLHVSHFRHVSRKPEVVVSDLRCQSGAKPFIGSAMCFRQGQKGVVYAIAADASTWKQDEPVLKKILSGFFYAFTEIGGNASPGKSVLPEMVTWRDPVENSFTCPVPRGWKVEGGLRRYTATDIRPEIVATNPAGSVLTRLGDAGIPTMVVNSPMLTSTGFQEGNWYSPDGLEKGTEKGT